MHLEGMHPMGVAMGAAVAGAVVSLETVGDSMVVVSPVVVVVVSPVVVVSLVEAASGHGSRGSHRGSTRGTLRKALTIR